MNATFPLPVDISGPPFRDSARLSREAAEQFKLVRIQSFNWGTFDGILKVEVSEKGMLFIGPSGSGKSTIFDSHAALLTPPRWLHYNVAARESESKQDRSAVTYVRGVWGEQTSGAGEIAQQQLRPGPTWSVISEVYRNDLGQAVTLAHVYWIKGSSNQSRDVNKRFLIAERVLELTELGFFPESGFNARRFKSDLQGVWDTDSFPEYQERMRSRLSIDTENALKLLHKTQSAKNLGSLTDFLRDFMLDEPKTHGMAEQLVGQFERLENAHNEVVSAARQIATLHPARQFWVERQRKKASLNEIDEILNGLDLVSRELLTALRQERQAKLKTELEGHQSLLGIKLQSLRDARSKVEGLKQLRAGLGGEQLASLEFAKATAEAEADERQRRHAHAAEACKALGLTLPSDPVGYAEQVSQGRRELANTISEDSGQSDKRSALAVEQHSLTTERDEAYRALTSLARLPRSKMPVDLVDIRKYMADALRIDEQALPFAGELIELEQAENGWQGAIERVLRGFARTLLVPENLYGPVSRYVNETHLRGRLVYLRMLPQRTDMPSPKSNGLYNKVKVSEGPFQAWVEDELLLNFDAACVETTEELKQISFGITRAGLMKIGQRRHEKDDRSHINNPKNWVLGADTRSKVTTLQDQVETVEAALQRVSTEIEQFEKSQNVRLKRALGWQKLVDLSWEDIDHNTPTLRVTKLAKEIAELHKSSPDLDILEHQILEAQRQEKQAESEHDKQNDTAVTLRIEIKALADAMEAEAAMPVVAPTPLQRSAIYQRLEDAGHRPTIELLPEHMRSIERKLRSEHGQLESDIAKLVHKIEQQFADYNRVWEAESGGLDPTLASYDEYDAKLTRLEIDDLPRFEAKFRELLNEQSNQHIALLSNQLEQERRDISDRMDTVNESLGYAEYNAGTHLVIEVEEKTPPEAQELKAQLREVLSHSLSMDDKTAEARFQAMKRLIKRLASQEPQQIGWRRLALDVRQHVEFIARELDEQNTEVLVHRSGAGKSGGQRQKLTATCLAAALRYQLGGSGRTLPTYSTIFLDEAFDKADADFTDAAMKIFKSFGFQLIIATPIKSVMTIEPYVGGAVFVHIKDQRFSRALVLPYDDETNRIDFRPVDGSSANDENA